MNIERYLDRCSGCNFQRNCLIKVEHYCCPVSVAFDCDCNSFLNEWPFKIGQRVWLIDDNLNIKEKMIKGINVSFPVKRVLDVSYSFDDCVAYTNQIFETRRQAENELFDLSMIMRVKNKRIKKKLKRKYGVFF